MKKSILLVLAVAFLSTTTFAQKKKSSKGEKGGGAYEKGELTLSVGLTGSNRNGGNSYYNNSLLFGPTILVEYGLTKDISLGGYLGTYFGGKQYTYPHGNHYHEVKDFNMDFYIGPKAAFHFGRILHMPSNLDWYAGHSLGTVIRVSNRKNDNLSDGYNDPGFKSTSVGFFLNIHTGFRWYFKPKMALFAEGAVGYNNGYGQIGLAFKF